MANFFIFKRYNRQKIQVKRKGKEGDEIYIVVKERIVFLFQIFFEKYLFLKNGFYSIPKD